MLYERAFFAIKFLEDAKRNRPTANKIDIITFIYINNKKLRSLNKSFACLLIAKRDNLLLQIEKKLYEYM